ncbi:MAG: hypothetical protein WD492_10290 [Alkalispirochaeta sp.]
METRRVGIRGLLPAMVVAAAVTLGCEVEPEQTPAGTVSLKDTAVSTLGTCQVVLEVHNTGDVAIEETDVVFSITTDSRRYYRRVVDGAEIPPGERVGIVEEITLDSPDEIVDTESTTVEWECFS